jgi:hypothetical protein
VDIDKRFGFSNLNRIKRNMPLSRIITLGGSMWLLEISNLRTLMNEELIKENMPFVIGMGALKLIEAMVYILGVLFGILFGVLMEYFTQ